MDGSFPEGAAGAGRPRLAIVALGCRVSRADADALAAAAAERFEVVRPGEPAELVVVNTCAITADAESTARQTIRRAAREHPGARIVAAGCCAGGCPDVLAGLAGVVAVVPPRAHGAIPEILARLDAGEDGSAAAARATEGAAPWLPAVPGRSTHARPLLKVQDGCDARCAYCIVPTVRGSSRSLPLADAVAAIVALGARHPEVVVTGVHLGAYGRDLPGAPTLAALVRGAVAGGFAGRLRLSSIDPGEFPEELLRDAGAARALCPHFHLPLQSGSASILAAMGRGYGPDGYRGAVERVAALAPGACIGADVLVGFPGERDADHRATVALVESLPLAYLHVFPFSPRSGTPAAALPDPVPREVVRARARELLAISDRRWRAFLAAHAGRELEVVVERVVGGLARGTSREFVPVRWPSRGESRGALVRVRVESCDAKECFGIRADAFASRLPP